jgi:hypothetical protein
MLYQYAPRSRALNCAGRWRRLAADPAVCVLKDVPLLRRARDCLRRPAAALFVLLAMVMCCVVLLVASRRRER